MMNLPEDLFLVCSSGSALKRIEKQNLCGFGVKATTTEFIPQGYCLMGESHSWRKHGNSPRPSTVTVKLIVLSIVLCPEALVEYVVI